MMKLFRNDTDAVNVAIHNSLVHRPAFWKKLLRRRINTVEVGCYYPQFSTTLQLEEALQNAVWEKTIFVNDGEGDTVYVCKLPGIFGFYEVETAPATQVFRVRCFENSQFVLQVNAFNCFRETSLTYLTVQKRYNVNVVSNIQPGKLVSPTRLKGLLPEGTIMTRARACALGIKWALCSR